MIPYFDEFVFEEVSSNMLRVEFDISEEDRKLPFHLRIDKDFMEQEFKDQFPDYDFYQFKNDNRNGWSNWIIDYIKRNIMNLNTDLEGVKFRLEAKKKECNDLMKYAADLNLKTHLLQIENDKLKRELQEQKDFNAKEFIKENAIQIEMGNTLYCRPKKQA